MLTHRLRLYPYSGGHIDFVEGELKECRRRASTLIRKHRNEFEYPVAIIDRLEWELQSDPEGMHMISDCEGILKIEELPPEPEDDDEDKDDGYIATEYECDECGDFFSLYELTDGLCGSCWQNQDDEDDDEDA